MNEQLKKKEPLIIAIETSCDETAVAISRGDKMMSNLVSSQIKDHQPYGGVVPELASRKHITALNYLIEKALDEAKVSFDKLDAVAVSAGPGLVGALMIGMGAAKTLSFALKIPLISINHIEAHLFSILHDNPGLKAPFIGLVVSGGHTMLVKVNEFGSYHILGQTLDDAVGEAFDKVAKLIGLSYPGGPEIEKEAKKGDENYYPLPRPLLKRDDYNFSFSGLKTAVVYLVRRLEKSHQLSAISYQPNIAASFQKTVTDILVGKAMKAAFETGLNQISVVGGVASNNYLRESFQQAVKEKGIKVFFPERSMSTDNAAMVALAANYYYLQGCFSGLDAGVDPNLSLVNH